MKVNYYHNVKQVEFKQEPWFYIYISHTKYNNNKKTGVLACAKRLWKDNCIKHKHAFSAEENIIYGMRIL